MKGKDVLKKAKKDNVTYLNTKDLRQNNLFEIY